MSPRYLSVGILIASLAPPTLAQNANPIETFTAFAADVGTGKTTLTEISVSRWSTDREREMLLATLQEFGPNKLVDTLSKIRPPVGYIYTPGRLRYYLLYARNNVLPDGSRQVVLATNRPAIVISSARSTEYQFTLVEIHLGADGKGEGKLAPAAKISWDKDAKKIEIENYDALPQLLRQVTAKVF
jgi:hypothetical protein